MKLNELYEAQLASGIRVTQLRVKAEEMSATRNLLIQELRTLEEATSYRGQGGVVNQVAVATKGINNRFVDKLYNYTSDLSNTMFIKILKALEKHMQ